MTTLDHADPVDEADPALPTPREIDLMTRRLGADFTPGLPVELVVSTVRECLYENPRGSAFVVEQAARTRLLVRAHNAAAPFRRR